MNKLEEYARAKLLLEEYQKHSECSFDIRLDYYSGAGEDITVFLRWGLHITSERKRLESYEELEKYLKEEHDFTFNTDPSPYIAKGGDIRTTKKLKAGGASMWIANSWEMVEHE